MKSSAKRLSVDRAESRFRTAECRGLELLDRFLSVTVAIGMFGKKKCLNSYIESYGDLLTKKTPARLRGRLCEGPVFWIGERVTSLKKA